MTKYEFDFLYTLGGLLQDKYINDTSGKYVSSAAIQHWIDMVLECTMSHAMPPDFNTFVAQAELIEHDYGFGFNTTDEKKVEEMFVVFQQTAYLFLTANKQTTH